MDTNDASDFSLSQGLQQLQNPENLSHEQILELATQIATIASSTANAAEQKKEYQKAAELYEVVAKAWRWVGQLLPEEWQSYLQSLANYWEGTAKEANRQAENYLMRQEATILDDVKIQKSSRSVWIQKTSIRQERVFRSGATGIQLEELAKKAKESGQTSSLPNESEVSAREVITDVTPRQIVTKHETGKFRRIDLKLEVDRSDKETGQWKIK